MSTWKSILTTLQLKDNTDHFWHTNNTCWELPVRSFLLLHADLITSLSFDIFSSKFSVTRFIETCISGWHGYVINKVLPDLIADSREFLCYVKLLLPSIPVSDHPISVPEHFSSATTVTYEEHKALENEEYKALGNGAPKSLESGVPE